MDIILLILQSIYFAIPAYLANMAPVIVKKYRFLESLNKPIDQNMIFVDKKPLFGSHKTYRGLFVAILFGILAAYLQRLLLQIPFFSRISILDYSNPLLIGFLLGLGAILGDLIKSFFKRRVSIQPGKKFIPFDQIDFIIGAFLLAWPFYHSVITISVFIVSVAASFCLHIIVNHTAYFLKIRKERW